MISKLLASIDSRIMSEIEVREFLEGNGLVNPEIREDVQEKDILWAAREDVRHLLRDDLRFAPNLVYLPRVVMMRVAEEKSFAFGDPTHVIRTTQSIDYFVVSKEEDIHKCKPKLNVPKFPKYFVRMEDLYMPTEEFILRLSQ